MTSHVQILTGDLKNHLCSLVGSVSVLPPQLQVNTNYFNKATYKTWKMKLTKMCSIKDSLVKIFLIEILGKREKWQES